MIAEALGGFLKTSVFVTPRKTTYSWMKTYWTLSVARPSSNFRRFRKSPFRDLCRRFPGRNSLLSDDTIIGEIEMARLARHIS